MTTNLTHFIFPNEGSDLSDFCESPRVTIYKPSTTVKTCQFHSFCGAFLCSKQYNQELKAAISQFSVHYGNKGLSASKNEGLHSVFTFLVLFFFYLF